MVDADLSLEVAAPSLGGGKRERTQEEGSDMDLKNCLPDGQSEEMKFGHNAKQECMAYEL